MNAALIFTGIEVLFQLIDRASAASTILKKAHAEGRPVSADELRELRAQIDSSLSSLDEAIARAESEGR